MNETKNIPFGRPWITDDERNAVHEVLNGDILTHGPQCKKFEDEFARFLGDNACCVSVSSCMAALHLAYMQMGVGTGDEIIVPAQTHVATAHAVELMGAVPVFCDCDRNTGNIDVNSIEPLITEKTKAISLVHYLGMPCDMDAVMEIAQRHGLAVVEDCAIALGARYRDRHVGLIGDAGCFSFYPVKHITTGEGGMFVTRRPEVAAKVAMIRGFGVDRTHSERRVPGLYDVAELGLNYRMSEIQAAVGLAQMRRIDRILECRRSNFERLKGMLSPASGFYVLNDERAHIGKSHYCLSVVLKDEFASRRNEIIERLNEAGIGTSIYYPGPVPMMSYYRKKYGYNTSSYKHASEISERSIAFPVGPHLAAGDMEYIAVTFLQILGEAGI